MSLKSYLDNPDIEEYTMLLFIVSCCMHLFYLLQHFDEVGRGRAHSYKKCEVYLRKVEGEMPAIFKGNIWKNMQTYIFVELFWYILLECTKEWKSGYYLYRMWSFPCPNQLRIAKSAPVLVQHVKNTNDSDADSAPTSIAAACACLKTIFRRVNARCCPPAASVPGQVRFRNNLTLVIWKLGLDFLQFSGFFPVLCTIAFPTNLWILGPSVGFGLDNL